MAVFLGLDVHRAQITFDALDVETGEVQAGRVRPANRDTFAGFLGRFDGAELVAAVEAMTGLRFVVEELERVGAEVHLAEPAETGSKRGPKRRAKTDRLDARLLRELLVERRLPEAWIPPARILDLRARVRLRKALVDQRTEWLHGSTPCCFITASRRRPAGSAGSKAITRASSSAASRSRRSLTGRSGSRWRSSSISTLSCTRSISNSSAMRAGCTAAAR